MSSTHDSSSVDRTEKPRTSPAEELIQTSEDGNENENEFKAGKRELLILGTMAALNVILALDATVLPPALPVSTSYYSSSRSRSEIRTNRAPRN